MRTKLIVKNDLKKLIENLLKFLEEEPQKTILETEKDSFTPKLLRQESPFDNPFTFFGIENESQFNTEYVEARYQEKYCAAEALFNPGTETDDEFTDKIIGITAAKRIFTDFKKIIDLYNSKNPDNTTSSSLIKSLCTGKYFEDQVEEQVNASPESEPSTQCSKPQVADKEKRGREELGESRDDTLNSSDESKKARSADKKPGLVPGNLKEISSSSGFVAKPIGELNFGKILLRNRVVEKPSGSSR